MNKLEEIAIAVYKDITAYKHLNLNWETRVNTKVSYDEFIVYKVSTPDCTDHFSWIIEDPSVEQYKHYNLKLVSNGTLSYTLKHINKVINEAEAKNPGLHLHCDLMGTNKMIHLMLTARTF